MIKPAAPDVVIVDDDPRRAHVVRELCMQAGKAAMVVNAGPEVRPLIELMSPELLVIDGSAADVWQVLSDVRARGYADAIIVVGAQPGTADWRALECVVAETVEGPDFGRVLVQQLRAGVIPRESEAATRFVHFEHAVVDLVESTVVRAGRRVRMSPTESALFAALLRERGAVVSRDALRAHVWGSRAPESRVVDRHITRLRRHIERDPRRPRHLKTVFGQGYQLS